MFKKLVNLSYLRMYNRLLCSPSVSNENKSYINLKIKTLLKTIKHD